MTTYIDTLHAEEDVDVMLVGILMTYGADPFLIRTLYQDSVYMDSPVTWTYLVSQGVLRKYSEAGREYLVITPKGLDFIKGECHES